MRDYQRRCFDWLQRCFGVVIATDRTERAHRFLEESLELVQAIGCTKGEALQLVDYVYGRPSGEATQEVGGTIVTLACLCSVFGLDLEDCAEAELRLCESKIEKIREKRSKKPTFSPLPQKKGFAR